MRPGHGIPKPPPHASGAEGTGWAIINFFGPQRPDHVYFSRIFPGGPKRRYISDSPDFGQFRRA